MYENMDINGCGESLHRDNFNGLHLCMTQVRFFSCVNWCVCSYRTVSRVFTRVAVEMAFIDVRGIVKSL